MGSSRLRDHIVANYMGGDGSCLDLTTPLLDLNILDSVAIFDLLHYIRTEMGVAIPLDEVSPDNFRTIAAIAQMVERAEERGRVK